MSIPRKSSRLLRIGSSRYRWRVRRRPTYAQALADSGAVLAIESADAAGGSVLVATLSSLHSSNWLELPGASVTPSLVCRIIDRALQEGWQPAHPGDQFRLNVSDVTPRPNA
jgi:hypothetical protein